MKGGNIETLLGTVSKILLDESKADSAVGSNVRNDNDSNDKKDGREMDFSADHLRSGASFSSVSQFHPYLRPQYQTEAAHRHPASDINGGGGSDRRGRGKEKEKDTANGASIESPGKGRGKGKVLKLHTLSTQELSQLVWTLGTLFSYPDQNQHYQPQPHLATASSVVPPFIIPRKVERLLEFLSTHVQADPFFSSSRRAPPLSACASPQTHTRASGEWQFCEVVDLLWGMSQIGLHTHHNTTQQEIDALFAASFPVVQAALSVDAHADAEAHTQAPMPFDHLEQDHQLLLALAQAYTNRERAHTHHYHRLQSARRYHNHPSVQQRYGRAEAEGERAEDVVQFRGEKQEVFELIARKLSFSASSLSSSTASPASHAVMEAPLSMFSDGDLSRVVALFGEHAVQSRNRQAQQDERKRSNDSPTGGALGTGKDHEQTEGNTDVSTGVACSEKQMDHSAVSRQPTEALFEAVARVIVSEGREELNQKQIRDIALGFNRMQLNHGKEGKAMLNYLSYLILYLPLKDNARPSLSSPSPSASAAYLHMHSGSGRTHGNQGHTDDGSGHDDQYSYQDANPEFARLIRNKQAFGAGWILLLALFYYRSFVYLTLKDENAERRKRLRNSMRVQRWQSLEQRER